MASPFETLLDALAQQAYRAAIFCHGDLGLDPEHYAGRLLFVTKKHLGDSHKQDDVFTFVAGLHTDDLYLTIACACPIDAAWERFTVLYQAFINKVAMSVCSTATASQDIAKNIPSHVFLPDASGRSRIASYEGRSSLAAWLSAVISNKAVKEQRRCNRLEQLDRALEISDRTAVERIEGSLRAGKYASLIRDALRAANKSLTERERFMVSLRYEEGLAGAEIAVILGVHASTVSRHLRDIYEKLQETTISTLASKHELQKAEIEECLDDLRENPTYSILHALVAGA